MWTGYQIFPSFKANGNLDFDVKMANLKMFIEVPFFFFFLSVQTQSTHLRVLFGV